MAQDPELIMSGKILIVDDERTIRMALRDTLTREGHLAVTASNGEEAVRRCKNEEFDLLITDMKMPGMTGLELIRQVRAMCPRIRTILITAYGSAESAIEALRMGVSDYMVKPFRLAELRMTTTRLLNELRAPALAENQPGHGEQLFKYFFNLGKDNSIVLVGKVRGSSAADQPAVHDAVRVAARAVSSYASKAGSMFDPAAAVEAISDMLYTERLAPVALTCTHTLGKRCVSACIGGLPAEAADPATAICRSPAAGSFPALRAVVQSVGGQAEPATASAVLPGSRTEFMAMPVQSAYTIALDSANLDLKELVEGIGRATRAIGLSNDHANEVIAAVNEAVLNAIEHGYGAGKSGKVDVSCHLAQGELVTLVRDYGNGFDPVATPDGGGFATLRRLMDRVAIESRPGVGTVVYLAKALQASE